MRLPFKQPSQKTREEHEAMLADIERRHRKLMPVMARKLRSAAGLLEAQASAVADATPQERKWARDWFDAAEWIRKFVKDNQ